MKRQLEAPDRVRRMVPALWLGCWLALFAAPVLASPIGEGEEPRPEAVETTSAAMPSEPTPRIAPPRKVAVDREFGELVAAPSGERPIALSPAVAKALSRSTEGLRVFDLANGGRGVDLEGRFRHVVMVRVMPDGSLETSCVDGARAAEELLGRGSAKADPGLEDK